MLICAHFGWSLEYVESLNLQQITRLFNHVQRYPADRGSQIMIARLIQSSVTTKVKLHELVPHLVDPPKPKIISDKERAKILMGIN